MQKAEDKLQREKEMSSIAALGPVSEQLALARSNTINQQQIQDLYKYSTDPKVLRALYLNSKTPERIREKLRDNWGETYLEKRRENRYFAFNSFS